MCKMQDNVFGSQPRHNPEDSSDEDVESESPLDEYQKPMFSKSQYLGGPPTSLSIRERRQRRDSVSRSDTSGSSAGDLGDITPCNASPHMPGLISFRAPTIRDEGEETWRRNMQSLLINQPSSHASELLLQLYRLVKVCFFNFEFEHVFMILFSGSHYQVHIYIEGGDEILYRSWYSSGSSYFCVIRPIIFEGRATSRLVQSKLAHHSSTL